MVFSAPATRTVKRPREEEEGRGEPLPLPPPPPLPKAPRPPPPPPPPPPLPPPAPISAPVRGVVRSSGKWGGVVAAPSSSAAALTPAPRERDEK